MSSNADIDGPPETKRFRIDINTQVEIDAPSVSTNPPVAGEASQDGQSPAAPSSASYRSSNSSVISSSESPIKEEEDVDGGQDESEDNSMDVNETTAGTIVNNTEILEMLNKTFGGVFNCDLEGIMRPTNLLHPSSPPTPVQSVVPGAVAVAQSPAAQLFANDDWSWHRNPAASIRSGGTNKQTPVWKYFVYNKTENLSRCIVGDCTYMLKGPHTSTLACHLKKHTREYSEFQKLKTEYSRTKLDQQPKVPEGAPHPLTLQTQNAPRQTGSPASTCNTNTNTSSSISSGSSGSVPSSGCGSTMDLSMKKPKKEPSSTKLNEMLLNGLRQVSNSSNGSPPTTPQTPQLSNMPSFVTNMMLQMNPLHMMLAQTLPGTTTPTSTSTCTSNAGLNALQQAGLTLAANGQIIQSKKWRNDDKKQKELSSKLALALASSHLNVEVLQNPLWKEVFEMAQPKFTIPNESQYDQIITSADQKLSQALKSQLSVNKKLNLLLDVTKITSDISRVTVSAAMTGGAGNSYETQVILLAFRNISGNQSEDLTAVFEKVLEDYGISQSSINRVICSGLNELAEPSELPKQMDAFSSRLAICFQLWLETSPTLEILKKNIYSMLLSYLTVPTAIQIASQMLKSKFELPVTETFPVIVENLLAHRDIYQMKLEGLTPISDREWSKVTGIHHLMNIFKPLMTYSTDMTTVDTVIPTIMQIQNVLEKDIYHLGDIGSDLLSALKITVAPIMNPENEHFDSTYIQATALNPQLAVTLSSEQMTIAKSLIESEISKRSKKLRKAQNEKKLAMGVDSLLANVMRKGDGNNGSNGGCDTLAMYGELFQSITGNSSESKENIVNQYFDEISTTNSVESMFMLRTFGNPMQAPLSYWKSCSSRCSELSDLATELLSIPIFTITAERVLSFSPNSNALNTNLVLTNLDTAELFEKQLLVRFNRQIVSKLFN